MILREGWSGKTFECLEKSGGQWAEASQELKIQEEVLRRRRLVDLVDV
jgi:hypothetical protein